MAYTLQDVQSMVRNDPAGLTGAPGNLADATYRIGGGNTGFSLNYSPEWMAAVNDTTPYQQGDSGYFWSDGDRTYTPSALKVAQLSGTANPADYITGFNYIPEISSDSYMGNSSWDPGFAGFIANLAPMVISSGIGAGISSIGGWGNLLDSISSGLSGAGDGLYGLELGGEGVGQALDAIPEYLDPTTGGYTGELPSLGSGISATGGGTGLQGYSTGSLYGNAGALGATPISGITGTVDGLGSLSDLGTLTPAAGGATAAYGAAPTFSDFLRTISGTGKTGSTSSAGPSFTSYLSDMTGIPSSVLSGIFVGAGALS